MNLNKETLVLFEETRSANKYYPPDQSNSFYSIGDGQINLFCSKRQFVLTGESGEINTGVGTFTFSNTLYTSGIIKYGSTLIVNDTLVLNNAKLDVYGELKIVGNTELVLRGASEVVMEPNSTLTMDENSSLSIGQDSMINVYGTIDCHVSLIDTITNLDRLYIDSSAVIKPEDIDLGDREFSVTDYDFLLRDKVINLYTHGERATPSGRIGYTWKGGSPLRGSQHLEMSVLWKGAILGDYKFSVLGEQINEIPNLQIIRNLHIRENCTLYIQTEYKGYTYLRPEIYLGSIIDNTKVSGSCVVDGSIVVNGKDSMITIDRGAQLTISESGCIYLQNDGVMRCTNNDDNTVLYINGKLIIDKIEQIETFGSSNIKFGENGKVVILNNYGYKKILFSTPNGKYNTDLYRIFGDRLEYVEYHINEYNGISIDQFYEHYYIDMIDWYNGMRIEKAIHEGLIVWDNGTIELDRFYTPWAEDNISLLDVCQLFKSYSPYANVRLQEAAERFKYVGVNNVHFAFIETLSTMYVENDDLILEFNDGCEDPNLYIENGVLILEYEEPTDLDKEIMSSTLNVINDNLYHYVDDSFNENSNVILNLEGIVINSITNTPASNEYNIDVSNDGMLFIKNGIPESKLDSLIGTDSQFASLVAGENTFALE